MMNYSSSRILTSMHPSIRHLNIRNVAKIVASKIEHKAKNFFIFNNT